MRRSFLLLLVLTAWPVALRAQAAEPMALLQLHPLVGSWEGTGWQLTGPGQRTEARVTERVELRLGGAALVVEGEGRAEDRVVHSALGVIVYDAPSASYRMRAFRADGHMVDAVLQVGEGSFQWGFADPRAGQIRYRARFTADAWDEIGEHSRDGGSSWQQFMAMTLRRVDRR